MLIIFLDFSSISSATRHYNTLQFFVSETVLCDKMQMRLFAILISLSFATKQNKIVAESDGNYGENVYENDADTILVKIEEDECPKTNVNQSQSTFAERAGGSFDRYLVKVIK